MYGVENFSEWQHKATIKNESKIYSACGDGKVPFVTAGDIARMAFHGLVDEGELEEEYRVLGSELLTHDDVCFPPFLL